MPLFFAICALISGKHFRWGQALLAVDGIARTPVPQKYWPLRPFPVLWYYKMWRQCLLRGKDSFLFLPLSSEVSDVRCIWEIKVRLTILIYAGFVDPKQCIFSIGLADSFKKLRGVFCGLLLYRLYHTQTFLQRNPFLQSLKDVLLFCFRIEGRSH